MADATNGATTPKDKKRRRPRGEGSIYETAAGRWRAAIVVEDPDTGRTFRRVVSGRSEAAVRERLKSLRRDVEHGAVAAGKPKSVAAYVATWLPALRGRVRPTTWRYHESLIRLRILPELGPVPLSALTPTRIEKWTTAIIAGTGPKVARRGKAPAPLPPASPTTARGARGTLRMILRDAERDGLVVRNAAALARPPRAERHELQILTATDTRRLIDGTTDDAFGPLYTLAALTGLRQGEVLGLRWTDVDVDSTTPTVTIRRAYSRTSTGWADAETKTSRSRRTLNLPPAAAAALRRQRTRQKEARVAAGAMWQEVDGCVFTDAIGRRVTGAAVTHQFSRDLARLGLPHVRFHDLRHGAASMMLAQGVPLKVVSETLGHAGIAITADTYTHLDRAQRREAADAMERAIGGGS